MAGTVTGTIGNNAGVFFRYEGTGAALHLDIGFTPSKIYSQNFDGTSPGTLTWVWNYRSMTAAVATINGWETSALGTGRTIGTVTDVASIQGVQIGTDTTINASGQDYFMEAWR